MSSDFDEVPQKPRARRAVPAAAVAAVAQQQEQNPAPASESIAPAQRESAHPRRDPRRRDKRPPPAAPASPLDAPAAETVPPPTRAATPVAGSPAPPARSGTLTGVGPDAAPPLVQQPPAPRSPPPAVKPWWVSKHSNGADQEGPLDPETLKAKIRAGVVGFGHFIWHATETKGEWIPFASGATSWLKTYARVTLDIEGGFPSLQALPVKRGDECVVPVRAANFRVGSRFSVTLGNATIEGVVKGFLLHTIPGIEHASILGIELEFQNVPPSGDLLGSKIQMAFDGQSPIEVLWVGDNQVSIIDWRFVKDRKIMVHTGVDSVPSVVSGLGLRVVSGVPEFLVTLIPQMEQNVAQPQAAAQPTPAQGAASVVTAPPPASVVAGFQPIVPPARPSPSPVVGWSGQAPPVATPPPPLPQPADPAQRRYCAHCGHDFAVNNERVCPRCQTVRGEAKPPQQQSVPASASTALVTQPAATSSVPAAHAAYAPPGTPTTGSIGKNFCEQCGHTRQHGAGLKHCEQCGHDFPN